MARHIPTSFEELNDAEQEAFRAVKRPPHFNLVDGKEYEFFHFYRSEIDGLPSSYEHPLSPEQYSTWVAYRFPTWQSFQDFCRLLHKPLLGQPRYFTDRVCRFKCDRFRDQESEYLTIVVPRLFPDRQNEILRAVIRSYNFEQETVEVTRLYDIDFLTPEIQQYLYWLRRKSIKHARKYMYDWRTLNSGTTPSLKFVRQVEYSASLAKLFDPRHTKQPH